MRIRGFLFLAATLGVFLLTFSPSTHAQTRGDLNLSTSPLPINLSLNPGTSISTDIRIKNGSPQTENIKVTLMKFAAFGEEGKPRLLEREPGDDYFDWVSFSPATFDAPFNEWRTVKMTINAPRSAAFGYYYAVVFSRANEAPPTGQGNVLLGSTAVLVLTDVKVANAKRSLELISFTSDRRSYEFLPANFSIRLHNKGNVHLLPKGNIFISRGGKQVASLPFNAGGGNILPSSNRIYSATWDDGFPVYIKKEAGGKVVLDKEGKPVMELRWDFSKVPKLKFGHYTAHLLVAYDDGTRDVPVEASLGFWVIPWRLVGIVLVIAVLAGFGLWSIGRSIYRKIKKKKK